MIDFIGNCESITTLREIVRKISVTDVTVLVTGESGTGKDLLVQLIRDSSKRNTKPFVVVNCGAIPYNLVENEFFGHVKGAYTDAGDDYKGKIGQADGGILYLDEVADLDLNVQAKLLRFLQFRVYQQVGSNKEVSADVRVIASTSKDLKLLVSMGRFREDLYYRLNVVPLFLPPLRERSGDISDLADYFLAKYCKKYAKKIIFAKSFVFSMQSYSFPGNVRELENLIEKEIVLSDGGVLTDIKHSDKIVSKTFLTLKEALDDFKRSYIIKSLDLNGWNQTKTAKMLDIQRTYLARLIKEYEISKL